MSNEILKNRFGDWKSGKDGRRREALEDLERAVLAAGQGGSGASPGASVGPFSVARGQAIQIGSTVFVVRGSVHAAVSRGEWMGEHGLGVVSHLAAGQAMVVMVGLARARVTRNSKGAGLQGGERLFVCASPGALAPGWPAEGAHVYPVAHVVGDHRGYLVDVWVNPQTGMRWG